MTDDELRLLTVIYECSGGMARLPVSMEKVLARCEELDVFEMTDERWSRYARRVLELYPPHSVH